MDAPSRGSCTPKIPRTLANGELTMYLFFKICVQQIQTSRRIAVDPAIVVIVAQSYAALPKFVLDKRVRQQIVLRGLELLWRYDFHQQTGAFSLVRQLCV